MNNVEVLEMVKEFLRLEALENELAEQDKTDQAHETNQKKWKVKKLATEYGVQNEFTVLLKEMRSK